MDATELPVQWWDILNNRVDILFYFYLTYANLKGIPTCVPLSYQGSTRVSSKQHAYDRYWHWIDIQSEGTVHGVKKECTVPWSLPSTSLFICILLQYTVRSSHQFLVVYWTTHSVPHSTRYNFKWLDKTKMTWYGHGRRWQWRNSRYFHGICLESLGKNTKTAIGDSLCSYRGSNRASV